MRAISPVLILCAVVLLMLPAAASEPGQPLDCSDWVFVDPGLQCAIWLDGCGEPLADNDTWCNVINDHGGEFVMDNEGRLYRLVAEPIPPVGACVLKRYTLFRRSAGATVDEPVAQIDQRCVEPATGKTDTLDLNNASLTFDEERGALILTMESRCQGPAALCSASYDTLHRIIAITGFTTTFEILQSYEPSTNAWGFRVPYMPEGLPAADSFDTYYGDLATVGDWSKAHLLQCGFPSAAPSTGDYVTVPDPLPNPAPHTGRYYVTAVNHQGQRRYGRQRLNGVLSGRDPAVLPVCQ